MIIRPAVTGDEPAIRAIVDAAYALYVPRIGRKPAPMLDDHANRIAAGETHVAEESGHILGVLVLIEAPDHLLLDNIAVAPGLQRRGVGRMLMEFAETEARRRGLSEIRLYTHEKMVENVARYPRLGYVETGRSRQAGYERVFFAKRL